MDKTAFTETKIFKVFTICIGILLILFYGFFILPVLVNFPDSWVGALYVTVGLGAGISCFFYIKNKSKILLIYIAIAFLVMAFFMAKMYLGES